MESVAERLARLIRDVPDFPQPGILFKDITTLLKEGPAFREAIDALIEALGERPVDKVVGIESRGFIFGAPIAYRLGAGFVPVRKMGKLPAETLTKTYSLEYGTAQIEIHRDAVAPGEKVLVVDDLLATGGTMAATIDLVRELGGEVVAAAFLVELTFLKGREKLSDVDVITVIRY